MIERIQYTVTVARILTTRKPYQEWVKMTDEPEGLGPERKQYGYAEPKDRREFEREDIYEQLVEGPVVPTITGEPGSSIPPAGQVVLVKPGEVLKFPVHDFETFLVRRVVKAVNESS